MNRLILPLILTLITGTTFATTSPRINFSVTPNPIVLGDTFNYHIELTAPETYSLVKIPNKTQLINTNALEYRTQTVNKSIQNNVRTVDLNYTLQAFEPGQHYIPTQTVVLKHKQSGQYVKMVLPTFPIIVNAIKAEDDFSLQLAEKIFIETSLNWWPIIAAILIAAALVFLGIKLFTYWRQHQPKEKEPAIPLDPRTPLEKSIEALQKNYATIDEQDIRLYYVKYSEIIKSYLGHVFSMKCVEMTTTETLHACKNRLSAPSFQTLKSMMQTIDLIKFANQHSTKENNKNLLEDAISLLTNIHQALQEDKELLP
jgi:hypothetical protein